MIESYKEVKDYEVLERLGGGGMGEVYRARDRKLGRYVALKFLAPQLSRSDEEKQRFLQEARAASALDHPNICTIHGLDETADGFTFIAMACYEGETLDRRIAGRPLPFETVISLGGQIASGLVAAHRQGIIHRDIKPANLLVTTDGVVKILDFGISKLAVTDGAQLTRPGALVGTVGYLSPEQAQGEEADRQTDIWALGVVLYEMVTGHRPFVAGNDLAILHKIAFGQAEPPSAVVPDVEPALERIIMRAMAHDRAARYPDLEVLLVDWEELVSEAGLSTGTFSAASRSGTWPAAVSPRTTAPTLVASPVSRRNLRTIGLAAALAVVLLLSAAVWWWNKAGVPAAPAGRPTLALTPLEDQSETAGTAWLGTAIIEMMALLLEQEAEVQPPTDPAALPATHRITGSFQLARGAAVDTIKLGLQLEDAAGTSLSQSTAEGPINALLLLVSESISSLGYSGEGKASAPGPRAAPTPEVRRLAAEGEDALWRLDALAARQLFQQALTQAPQRPALSLGLAAALGLLGYEEEQRTYARQAVAQARHAGIAARLAYHGRALEAQREYGRAAALLQALWLADGGTGGGVARLHRGVHLALVLGRSGEGEAALAMLEDLAATAAGDPRLPLAEAEVAYRMARYRQQQAACQRAAAAAAGEEDRFLRARALHLEGEALRRLGTLDEAIPLLEEARAVYAASGHAKGEGDVLYTLANLAWDRRDLAIAKAQYEAAALHYAAIGNRRMQARTLANQGLVLQQRGDLEAAIEIFRQALALFRDSGDRQAAAVTLVNLAQSFAAGGRFAEADESYEQIFVLLDQAPEPSIEGFARAQMGGYLLTRGRLAAARRELDAALALQGATGDYQLLAEATFNLARLLHMQGEPLQAQQTHEEALVILAESGPRSAFYLQVRSRFCDLLRSRGELAAARTCFDEALAIQDEMVNPLDAAETRLSLARLDQAEDQPAAAAVLVRSTITDLERRGAVLAAIRAHSLLARSLLAADDLAAAEEELAAARRLLADRESPPLALPLALLDVRLRLAHGATDEARQVLQTVLAAATQASLSEIELEANLLLGEIELRDGSPQAGRSRLAAVAAEAEQKGYGLLAAQATRARAASALTSRR